VCAAWESSRDNEGEVTGLLINRVPQTKQRGTAWSTQRVGSLLYPVKGCGRNLILFCICASSI
jgi:hypothetical protein